MKHLPLNNGMILVFRNKYPASKEDTIKKIPVVSWITSGDLKKILNLYSDNLEFEGILVTEEDLKDFGITEETE